MTWCRRNAHHRDPLYAACRFAATARNPDHQARLSSAAAMIFWSPLFCIGDLGSSSSGSALPLRQFRSCFQGLVDNVYYFLQKFDI
jgi:hypothetical protein